MDSTDEMTRAQLTLNPEDAARVIRGIADIERDYRLAEGAVSDRFLWETASAMRKWVPEPWQVIETDWGITLTAPDWRSTKGGLGQGDAWFELGEIADDEQDHTWIAAAIGAGPTKMSWQLNFRPGLIPNVDLAKTQAEIIAPLLKLGFQHGADGKMLYLPVAVSAEALAKAFGENDFDKALLPVRKAVDIIVKAKADLDVLIGAVRDKGKRK